MMLIIYYYLKHINNFKNFIIDIAIIFQMKNFYGYNLNFVFNIDT
jgi:hypothetical protein